MKAGRRQMRKSAHAKGLWTPPPHGVGTREHRREDRFVPAWVTNVKAYREHSYGVRQAHHVIGNLALVTARAKERAAREQAEAKRRQSQAS